MAGITLAVRVRDARFVARQPSLAATNVTSIFRFLTHSGAVGVSLVV